MIQSDNLPIEPSRVQKKSLISDGLSYQRFGLAAGAKQLGTASGSGESSQRSVDVRLQKDSFDGPPSQLWLAGFL